MANIKNVIFTQIKIIYNDRFHPYDIRSQGLQEV